MSVPVDLTSIATGLREVEPGLLESASNHLVSYPESRHGGCYSVEDASFWFGHRNRCITSTVARFPPGGMIFDIGGGNGFVTGALREAGFPSVLVEPGRSGIDNARARGLTPVVWSTFEDAGFRSQSLAAAGLFDVLEHIEDDVAFLREVRDCLVPGGRLYLTVPAYQLLWSHEDKVVGHWRRYRRSSLTAVLDKAGFDVKHISHLFWFLPVPILLFRVLPSMLRPHAESLSRQVEQDHSLSGLSRRLVAVLLNPELAMVARGRRIPIGSSIVAVAERA